MYFQSIFEPDNRVVVRSSLGQEIQIARAFEFSSLLQRMSVIVKINEEFYLFAKGSPEMMKTLSIKKTRKWHARSNPLSNSICWSATKLWWNFG